MTASQTFRSYEAFKPDSRYRLLPFRFMRWSSQEVLLVNDVGEFVFLGSDHFQQLTEGRLDPGSRIGEELTAKCFLAPRFSTVAFDLVAAKLRTKKSFLRGFTKLHIFVVTLRCDTSCKYCQVSRSNSRQTRFDMSEETAAKAIDLMFESPAEDIKVEIQGGEPLLHFERIEQIFAMAESHPKRGNRRIQFVVASHLGLLDRHMLERLARYGVHLSTSLDGPRDLHEANRPRPAPGSYLPMVEKLDLAREILGPDAVSAVMTTTERSLSRAEEIVDEYVRLGFRSIFLRSISPYGLAVKTGESGRYDADLFLEFYRRAFDRILDWNRQGQPLVEVYAQFLLSRILTPFSDGYVDLQSPTGLGIGVAVYNYDGDVYASDEARMLAEMGDRSFRLGNVHQHDYRQIFGGTQLRTLVSSSVQESWPGCHECAFLPYCGTDVLFNYREQRDLIGHRPTSSFCRKNMGILRFLFDKLRTSDEATRDLLTDWACAG